MKIESIDYLRMFIQFIGTLMIIGIMALRGGAPYFESSMGAVAIVVLISLVELG